MSISVDKVPSKSFAFSLIEFLLFYSSSPSYHNENCSNRIAHIDILSIFDISTSHFNFWNQKEMKSDSCCYQKEFGINRMKIWIHTFKNFTSVVSSEIKWWKTILITRSFQDSIFCANITCSFDVSSLNDISFYK